ncbi:major facilitator superfamily domain-containing protein [Aspergillus californicus]
MIKTSPLHNLLAFCLLNRNDDVAILENGEGTWTGEGSHEHPYLIDWIPNDTLHARNYSTAKKRTIITLSAVSTLSVAFASSVYTGGLSSVRQYFGVSDEMATLGLSLFVLGFAIGPLIWAPLGETFGRRNIFLIAFSMFTIFNLAAAVSPNFASLVVFRAFAGIFGSAPLTNSGGIVADLYTAEHRGLAAVFYSGATFLGPILGPIAGGFLGESQGWRWIEGLLAIYTGLMLILGYLFVPETFGPVLLRRRAALLSESTGKVFATSFDRQHPAGSLSQRVKISIRRPLVLLFTEPIVAALAFYNALIYGTTYLLLAALPVVFQRVRGWSPGIGGLAFIPIAIGMAIAILYMIFVNRRYTQVWEKSANHELPPEARLPSCKVGATVIPIGLFLFAWSNAPSVHWAVCMIGTALFGFGNISVSLGLVNYIVDSYVTYAASALAASTVLRSLCGAAFPLFTTYMYEGLGIHWASSVPAFLALACLPLPFVLSRHGHRIRRRSKFAAEMTA